MKYYLRISLLYFLRYCNTWSDYQIEILFKVFYLCMVLLHLIHVVNIKNDLVQNTLAWYSAPVFFCSGWTLNRLTNRPIDCSNVCSRLRRRRTGRNKKKSEADERRKMHNEWSDNVFSFDSANFTSRVAKTRAVRWNVDTVAVSNILLSGDVADTHLATRYVVGGKVLYIFAVQFIPEQERRHREAEVDVGVAELHFTLRWCTTTTVMTAALLPSALCSLFFLAFAQCRSLA